MANLPYLAIHILEQLNGALGAPLANILIDDDVGTNECEIGTIKLF